EAGREGIVGIVVVVGSQTELLQIVPAAHTVRRFANFLHCWQQQADQNRNDGDDHQQLDQRKPDSTLYSDHELISKIEKRNHKQTSDQESNVPTALIRSPAGCTAASRTLLSTSGRPSRQTNTVTGCSQTIL